MAALNYKHLRYFLAVARAGSIARAGEELHLTPQSISGQLRELEDSLQKLVSHYESTLSKHNIPLPYSTIPSKPVGA